MSHFLRRLRVHIRISCILAMAMLCARVYSGWVWIRFTAFRADDAAIEEKKKMLNSKKFLVFLLIRCSCKQKSTLMRLHQTFGSSSQHNHNLIKLAIVIIIIKITIYNWVVFSHSFMCARWLIRCRFVSGVSPKFHRHSTLILVRSIFLVPLITWNDSTNTGSEATTILNIWAHSIWWMNSVHVSEFCVADLLVCCVAVRTTHVEKLAITTSIFFVLAISRKAGLDMMIINAAAVVVNTAANSMKNIYSSLIYLPFASLCSWKWCFPRISHAKMRTTYRNHTHTSSALHFWYLSGAVQMWEW